MGATEPVVAGERERERGEGGGMNTSDGLVILPTRGRTGGKLERCLRALKETGTTTQGVIVVGEDDYAANQEAYDSLELPKGWWVDSGAFPDTAAATEWARATFANMGFYVWLTDDSLPETPQWDAKLAAALNRQQFRLHGLRREIQSTEWCDRLLR